jgi:hypothetical protein
MVTQPFSRWLGLLWMVIGVVVFVAYRRIKHLPLIKVTEINPDKDV